MSEIRSYTNGADEVIEVSKEHLDVAVDIKMELQKFSPSLRCDWKRHKKLMQEEGFYDSDTNEAYRCLIKDWQKQAGLLPSVGVHVDLVATSKLRSLGNLLGELYSEKRENQVVLNELRAFKRDFHLSKVVAEEIIEEFKTFKLDLPKGLVAPKIQVSKDKAVIILTDLHVGATIRNVYGNNYNYEIAKKRMQLYLQKVIKMLNKMGITDVLVVGLGDFVEHVNMRYKQSNEAEFKLAQQILKASELVISFLVSLANAEFNVEYTAIAGNHDRLQGDKNIAFDDDNANVIINSNVETFIKLTNSPRLTYCETEDGATEINKLINGKKIKFVHGHLDSGNKKDRMKGYISMQNDFFDALVYGHLHHYHVEESDHGRMTIGVGCLSGRNDYGKHFSAATNASQMLMLVTGDGELLPMRIDLQEIA